MKKIILIMFLLMAALAAYLYWVEPDTLQRLLQPAPETVEPKHGPDAKKPVRPKPEAAKPGPANARLIIPQTEATVYLDGKRVAPGKAKVAAGVVVVASYREGHYSHELVRLDAGGEASASLQEQVPAAATGWSTYQGNAERTGFSAAVDRTILELQWQLDFGDKIESSFIAVEHTAFFSSEDHLINGLDLVAGKLLWSEGSMGAAVTPIADDQHVFAGSDTGRFAGYRLRDGKPRGERFIDSYPTSMALISQDSFLVTNGQNKVFSIKTKKGFTGKLPLKVNWEKTYDELAGKPSTPALSQGIAVFMTEHAGLFALDLASGQRLWSLSLAGDDDGANNLGGDGQVQMAFVDFPVPTPAISGDTVYAGKGTTLVAADLGSGRVLWRAETPSMISSSLACAYGMLIFGSEDGKVRAFSSLSGAPIYQVALGREAVTAAPVVFRDKLLVGSGAGMLFLLNCFSGEPVAESDVLAGAAIVGSPLVTDHCLVAANEKGRIACFK